MEICDQVEGKDEEDQVMKIDDSFRSSKLIDLLRRFLGIQQRRAEAYTKLHRYH